MVYEARQAAEVGGGAASWVNLDRDLMALPAVALSKRWPTTTAAARLPQLKAVQTDCASIGAG